jgi:glycosyltransferase involved in cell wall biosynthesis
MPEFVVILPVREEADIIAQCLDHLLGWADAIYAFDTGSVDNTWEIVQEFASREKRVVPMQKEPVFFSEARLRGYMFHVARQKMHEGDWFLRADADEFHHITPPEFVKNCMRKHETVAYHQYYDFHLLQSELDAWNRGEETLKDRQRPIEDRRRYYTVSHYSEPRLCRYRNTMQWPPTVSFPFNAGYVARERLPIRHYPYRDPVQSQKRSRLRALMVGLVGDQLFTGYGKDDVERYRRYIASRQTGIVLSPAVARTQIVDWSRFVTPDDLAGLKYWKPASELPLVQLMDHLRLPHIRAVQRCVHAFGLPMLDRLRPKFPANWKPQRIPREIVEKLQDELSES